MFGAIENDTNRNGIENFLSRLFANHFTHFVLGQFRRLNAAEILVCVPVDFKMHWCVIHFRRDDLNSTMGEDALLK